MPKPRFRIRTLMVAVTVVPIGNHAAALAAAIYASIADGWRIGSHMTLPAREP